MKIFKQLLFAALCCWLVACSVGNKPVPEETSTYFESVTDSAVYSAKEFMTGVLGESYAKLTNVLTGKLYDIKADVIRYYTKDPEGNRILASGVVTYPQSAPVKGVILSEHYTIGANRESPSGLKYSIESSLSALGYVVVSPDYIGFGVSQNLPHTYLHVESTATASIDMLFAVREYMDMINKPLDKDISIMGYSQGGASALAVQKVAEERFADLIHVKKVIAGAGPYDLVLLFEGLKYRQITPSAYVPMTVIGLDYGDQLGLDYKKLFKEPLLSNYNEWINSKKYTTTEIDGKLGADFLSEDFFTNEQNNSEIEKLRPSLERNSLIDWTPKAPIRLIHGANDKTVPLVCSESAYNSFKPKGCDVELVKIPLVDHSGAVPFYIIDAINHL